MNFLCWHGTVLRVDKADGTWFHALPWPDDDAAADLDLDLPDSALRHPLLVDGLVFEPAPVQPRIFIRRDRHYLSAETFRPLARFVSTIAAPTESFIAVTPHVMAGLRAVLRGPSRIAETGLLVQAARADGFRLSVDGHDYPLWTAQPGQGGGLVVEDGAGLRTLVPEHTVSEIRRIPVPCKPADPTIASDASQFLHGTAAMMTVAAGEDMLYPPVTLSDADQIWIQQKPWWPDRQRFGTVSATCRMGRVRGAFVMTRSGQEGTIFNEDGIYTDPVHLDSVDVFADAPVSRHGRRVFLDEAALRAAPVLEGPHVVFYGGIARNYYHWLIESLVPLCTMAPHLPAGTKLLLPESFGGMHQDGHAPLLPPYRAMLQDWGFGDMPSTLVPSPVCLVEEVYYLADLNLESFPASVLKAARMRVLEEQPVSHGKQRLYIRRPYSRRVGNAAEIEAAVQEMGFTVVEMTGRSAAEQVALFRNATVVIAPHGAELANLLFCAPGAQVIELSPAVQFRYFYAQLSDKLGLSHAVLPCASLDGQFDGDMHVDAGRLHALLRLMQARS